MNFSFEDESRLPGGDDSAQDADEEEDEDDWKEDIDVAERMKKIQYPEDEPQRTGPRMIREPRYPGWFGIFPRSRIVASERVSSQCCDETLSRLRW